MFATYMTQSLFISIGDESSCVLFLWLNMYNVYELLEK
jgi:hypothetical protein